MEGVVGGAVAVGGAGVDGEGVGVDGLGGGGFGFQVLGGGGEGWSEVRRASTCESVASPEPPDWKTHLEAGSVAAASEGWVAGWEVADWVVGCEAGSVVGSVGPRGAGVS